MSNPSAECRRRRMLPALALLAVLSGCGSDGPPTVDGLHRQPVNGPAAQAWLRQRAILAGPVPRPWAAPAGGRPLPLVTPEASR